METIFDHKVTVGEVREAVGENNATKDPADYLAAITKRAEWKKVPVEYMATVDLESLFDLRNDAVNLKRIKKILDEKFAAVTAKLFNE